MKRMFQVFETWLSELGLERKVLVLLGLSMTLVMLVSAVLIAWGTFVWYGNSVDRKFTDAQTALAATLKRHAAESERLAAEVAGDAGLALRLDSIAEEYVSRTPDLEAFLADQHAVMLRLARLAPSLGALIVAYDRDGEPVSYFDGRNDRFAMGRFSSPVFPETEANRSESIPVNGTLGGRPLMRTELALPGRPEGFDWRLVDGQLAQAFVTPVFADVGGARHRAGYVAVLTTHAVDDLNEAARSAGLQPRWILPGDARMTDAGGVADAARFVEAADLAALARQKSDTGNAAGTHAIGRFEDRTQFARVFSLAQERGRGVRFLLTLDKSSSRLRALLAFLAAMLIPLLACVLSMVPVMRLARRHLVRPVVDLAGEIDAVKEGRYRPEQLPTTRPDRDEIGHLHRVLGELADELSRREQDSWIWTSVFQRTREAIFVTDIDGSVEYVNQAFTEVSGISEEDALGKPVSFLQAGLHDEVFYAELWNSLRVDGHWSGEVWDLRRDGTAYPQWLSLSAVTDSEGRVTHYAGIFSDISERKAQEERISYLAHHDTLTGLPNRSMLMERLRVALTHADREGHQVGVLFIDLDRFKIINDTLGHSIGDGLLQTVAERLKRAVRASDTVSRLGGDEFIVLLYKLRALEDAERVAEHILGVLAPTARIDGHELAITPSIGIAVYPENGIDADDLIRNADVAMYHAKSQGRNNYQVFNPALTESAEESLTLEHALRSAADRDEFTLFYQPQIEVATRKLVGVEALIRWNSEEFGLVPPSKFIRIAEECGLILQMGDWVLREACRQRAEWNADGIASFPIAVNVSALQFRQPEFVRRVEEAMQIYGIPAAQLELELTESIVMHESGTTAAALQRLREMGVAMAIDDFGTGYSSLGYLKHLPIQKLKIDGAFVRGIETDAADRAIVEAIISLGRALDLTLVAEGVEQRSSITLLGKLGCHVAQGYYYCRPLPADDFAAWFREFSGEGRRLSVVA